MDTIELRDPKTLKPHPRNSDVFGPIDKDGRMYKEIKDAIEKNGIQEPLIITEDSSVLSGHIRLSCALDLNLKEVPVRVHPHFDTLGDEFLYLVDANVKRRQLSPTEMGKAYNILKTIPEAQGGLAKSIGPSKKQRGPLKGPLSDESDAKGAFQGPPKRGPRTRDAAAEHFGVGKNTIEALSVITKNDVPKDLLDAVDEGTVSAQIAAKAVKETRSQGVMAQVLSRAKELGLIKATPTYTRVVTFENEADLQKVYSLTNQAIVDILLSSVEAVNDSVGDKTESDLDILSGYAQEPLQSIREPLPWIPQEAISEPIVEAPIEPEEEKVEEEELIDLSAYELPKKPQTKEPEEEDLSDLFAGFDQ